MQDIELSTAKLIWALAGENKVAYDSFRRTDIFEFYRLVWIQQDLIEERLKNYESLKNKSKNG